jgi:CHAD domain-containing protein
MPYRFLEQESVPDGIRRIAQEQAGRAIAELTDEALDRHERVHQARKRFKKLRGLLRLARFALEEAYREENTSYRDLGRALSDVRDAAALLETYDLQLDTYASYVDAGAFASVRQTLAERRRAVFEGETAWEDRLRDVLDGLHEARGRIAAWPLKEDRFSALGPGLQKTYGRGRRAFHTAYDDPTPEHFHEWRKRVKYHWYHARLLQNTWSPLIKGYRRALKDLSDLLGDHHDLAIFRQTLVDESRDFGEERDLQVLMGLIDRRQAELAAKARTIGQRVYHEKPKRLEDRFHTYWDAWRTETDHEALLVD